jgi:hypothetical protein
MLHAVGSMRADRRPGPVLGGQKVTIETRPRRWMYLGDTVATRRLTGRRRDQASDPAARVIPRPLSNSSDSSDYATFSERARSAKGIFTLNLGPGPEVLTDRSHRRTSGTIGR